MINFRAFLKKIKQYYKQSENDVSELKSLYQLNIIYRTLKPELLQKPKILNISCFYRKFAGKAKNLQKRLISFN